MAPACMFLERHREDTEREKERESERDYSITGHDKGIPQ